MKNPILSLTLPLSPSVNHYWASSVAKKRIGARTVHYVNVRLSDDAKIYRAAVIALIMPMKLKTITTRVRVNLTHHAKTKTGLDLDNYQKGVFDALTHAGVWVDDKQVDEFTVSRGEVIKGGLCRVEIFEIGDL